MKNDKNEFLPLPAGYKMSEGRKEQSKIIIHTFKEWSDLGYQILKGAKHIGRDKDRKCLFSSSQVMKVNNNYYGEEESDDEFDLDLPGNPMDYGDS